MDLEVLVSLAAGVSSLLVGLASALLSKRFRQLSQKQEKPYAERLEKLMASLTKASREVDSILAELGKAARDRESAVQELEAGVQALESREKELQSTIDALERTPLPVAERFAELIGRGEKRSRKRDYILFGAGVGVTTGIAIIIQLVA